MKTIRSTISILLITVVLLGVLSACTHNSSDTSATDHQITETSATESQTTETDITETQSDSIETESEHESESEKTMLNTPEADSILYANSLINGVNACFEQGTNRNSVIVENQNMTLNYAVSASLDQTVSSLKNKNGNSYIENTFDVFVKLAGGERLYASKTLKPTAMNIYRFGYYMYEVRFEEQDFFNGVDVENVIDIDLNTKINNNIALSYSQKNDELSATMRSSSDPYVIFKIAPYSADNYQYAQITIKSEAKTTRSGTIYFKTKSDANFTGSNTASFYIPSDGQYHTCIVNLGANKNYTGEIDGFRLDINAQKDENFIIQDIKLIEGEMLGTSEISLNRSFFTYSDKMHHVAQIVAHREMNNVEEVGMITKIKADTVAKLIVKDISSEHHTTLDGVDWDSAEYVGFDIKEAGVFGYILPVDGSKDKLTVTLEDGYYVITQVRIPNNNTLIPSVESTLNANDIYMGQRIYTDECHDFEGFIHEAYCERNPLETSRFRLDSEKSVSDAAFVGYDPLRGAYKFTLKGARNFFIPYSQSPDKHYNVSFTFKGDDIDRRIYFYTSTDSGVLECAALLDGNDMLIPIPLEVGKNFHEAISEANIYNIDDATYGEVIFPLLITENRKATYTIAHLYQDWGNFPIKQISWIQYHAPYYHLSTGVTETNCITPYYSTKAGKASLQMLPDHRSWSAPMWAENDPQHTSGGSHSMLTYTDDKGNYYSSDSVTNWVGSYGPTYADVTMYHCSDDGRIKYSIKHMEMPQTDENRGYYEFNYEVLEDLTISNFKQDFSFYSVTDNNGDGYYTQFGYLNEENQCTVQPVNNANHPVYYVLGNDCPYFDYFNMVNYSEKNQPGYVNVSFLIYNSEITIGGKRSNAPFVVKEFEGRAYLSLDLEKVTLKKGDTITINAIIMPWGSQESEYPEDAPDYNVRNVRENTLLDPVKVTPVENCETIESVYLPKVQSTNGKDATFTLSGGHNNIAIRVYGFNKLTAPKVYEKEGGDWVEVILSSSANPDDMGNYQYYDGYNVYYDGDGTYSYAFVAAMEDGTPRTFKVDASNDFERWPKINKESPDLLDFYLDPTEISNVILYPEQFSSITMNSEDFDYISFYGNSHVSHLTESYFYAYNEGSAPTGGVLAFKYRLPEENPDKIFNIEFYVSTVNDTAKGGDSYWTIGGLIPDGEWHVLIVDLASFGKSTFTDDGFGKYETKYIRVDPFNAKFSNDTRIDVAFIGMVDRAEDVYAICSDMSSITLCKEKSTNVMTVDPNTGEIISGENTSGDDTEPVDPTSQSDIDLCVTPDMIDAAIEDRYQFAKIEKGRDENTDYISFYGNSYNSKLSESYLIAYKGGDIPSGSYLIMKYRLPSTNSGTISNFQFYTSTVNSYAATENDAYWITEGIINDGNWHVIIIDLASFNKLTYVADESGKYTAKYIRFDPFNSVVSKNDRIDVAYIGMSDSLQDALTFNKEFETVSVCKASSSNIIIYDTETGRPVGNNIDPPSSVKMFFYGNDLKKKAESDRAYGVGSAALSDDSSYVTLKPSIGAGESGILFHHNTSGSKELGQYLVIKYRTALFGERFEIYASTGNINPSETGKITINTYDNGYANDGEWHILIVDLSVNSNYIVSSDGKYYPMHIRFDFINTNHLDTEDSIDVGYFGVGTNVLDILSLEKKLSEAWLYDSNGLKTISVETGEVITN